MPRTPDPRNAYLELHDGYYRVTMGVPAKLRPLLGNRLKKSLRTKSLISANVLKRPIVAKFQDQIRNAWEAVGGQPRSELEEALQLAAIWTGASERGSRHIDEIRSAIANRAGEIMLNGAIENYSWADDHENGEEQVYDPILLHGARDRAEAFKDVAFAKSTPISAYHAKYKKTLRIKPRSLVDDERALKIFLDWCLKQEIPPYLEQITTKVAFQFLDEIEEFTGLSWASCTKYLGRLRKYWEYLAERSHIEINVWPSRGLEKPFETRGEKERAFTNAEVVTLLTGTTETKMLDVMLIACLSGARVDAVIDLKVRDCDHGCFWFKPQKREEDGRYVPTHPDLKELVARRTRAKLPDDDIFPEWPLPQKEGSIRERSSYFSKRFTVYRRSVGVNEERKGKRRSLVNFHSFRRWFITKGERAGINGDLLAAIVGHKRSGLTLGHYSEGPAIRQANVAIAKIKLPPLDGRPAVEELAMSPRVSTGRTSAASRASGG